MEIRRRCSYRVMRIFLSLLFLLLYIAVTRPNQNNHDQASIILAATDTVYWYPSVGAIKTPEGYKRIPAEAFSFTACLRNIPLKKDKTVTSLTGK